RQQTGQRVYGDLHAVNVDTRKSCRFLVAADVVNLAEGGRTSHQKIPDEHDAQGDKNEVGNIESFALSVDVKFTGQSGKCRAFRHRKADTTRDTHHTERRDE